MFTLSNCRGVGEGGAGGGGQLPPDPPSRGVLACPLLNSPPPSSQLAPTPLNCPIYSHGAFCVRGLRNGPVKISFFFCIWYI